MNILSTLSLSLTALLRNKMRSLLTMLGIIIGVAAVIVMQAMGMGATAYVGEAISGLGTNMLIAIPGSSRNFGPPLFGVPLFTLSDVEALQRHAHDLDRVTPVNTRLLRVVAGSNNRNVNTTGVTPDYFVIRQWNVVLGRGLTSDDNRRAAPVCVLGQTVSDALFVFENPVGKDIRLRDLPCRVVGVLETKGSSAFGMDQDDVVFMPFATFSRRIIGNDRVGTIMASAMSENRIDDAKHTMITVLHQRRHVAEGEEDDFAVRDPRETQALLRNVTGILTTVLAGVAAISLLVGGIGIMNIMLVSVTERTREIGIRLAVGARSDDILSQFLIEAMALCVLGGILGVATGLACAYGIASFINVPFVLPGVAVPIAFGASVLVGVTFGVFPARKAARLNPLAALRFE